MNLKKSTLTLSTVLVLALIPHTVMGMEKATAVSYSSTDIPLQALGSEVVPTTVRVRCNDILTADEKHRFYDMGVDTIVYAGDNSYYFYLPESLVTRLLSEEKIASIEEIDARMRTEDLSSGTLAVLSDDEIIDINVLFLREMSRRDIEALLAREGIGAEIQKVLPSLRSATLRLSVGMYKKLADVPLVQYMDKVQKLLTTQGDVTLLESRNAKTAKYSDVMPLWSDPYDLNGRNMLVGVVDGGSALITHQEFGGRVHDETASGDVNMHATHVAGTIAAAGVNPDARGMARETELYSYSFLDASFSEAVLNMYRSYDILISNHSYGYSLKERLGEYDSVAATQDLTVYNNPYLNIFEAAGNDGIDDSYAEYGIIKGPGNSKNILTIGALDSLSDEVAKLSSTGPVRDGRIKPDLCVRGEYVVSASSESNEAYRMMSGTSMATPAATGIGVLVAQAYKKVTGGYDIRHDTLKAVLINTARDIANPGPDYKAGFGLIDAKAAVDTVMTITADNPKVSTGEIRHNAEVSYRFTLTGTANFKTTIAWVDPEADPSSFTTLVNDIDMVLVNTQTGAKYYPYTLDPDYPSRYAVQSKPNKVDNIEQIEVRNLPAGEYTLIIQGSKIVTDTQEYTIASSLPMFTTSNIETLRPSNIQNFARTIFLSTF